MVALFTRAWIEIILPDEPYPDHFVALFTRAWIEILLKTVTKMTEKGRPLHEGVDWNHWYIDNSNCDSKSPSSRGRGLKYILIIQLSLYFGRPLHEGVDWNRPRQSGTPSERSRPLHEGVDWNVKAPWSSSERKGRPLHEGVDWNIAYSDENTYGNGRPLHEGVDWNYKQRVQWLIRRLSPSSRGRGLK